VPGSGIARWKKILSSFGDHAVDRSGSSLSVSCIWLAPSAAIVQISKRGAAGAAHR